METVRSNLIFNILVDFLELILIIFLKAMYTCLFKLVFLALILGTIFNVFNCGEWFEESFDDIYDVIQENVGDVFGANEDGRLRRQIAFEDQKQNFDGVNHKKA